MLFLLLFLFEIGERSDYFFSGLCFEEKAFTPPPNVGEMG
jgi:hypothetical protein